MNSFWDNLKAELKEIGKAVVENPLVTSLGFIAILIVFAEYGTGRIHDGLAKDTQTFVVLVLLGGAVSLVFQRRLQKREEEERERSRVAEITDRERELLLDLHEDLVSAYNKARRVRRLLRAQLEPADGGSSSPYVPRRVYDEQLATLTDAQLEFDSLQRRIEGNRPLFGEKSHLAHSVKLIEKNLKRAVKEYVGSSQLFANDPPRTTLAELPALTQFLGLADAGESPDQGSDGQSKRKLRDEFERAHGFLRREIDKRAPRRIHGGCILWIDDHPENNAYEKSELRKDEHDVVEARSTREALQLLLDGKAKPVAVISDMEREEDGESRPEAGLELIKALRSDPSLPDPNVPVLIYTWSAVVEELGPQVEEAGGNITAWTPRLFAFVEAATAPPA